MVGMEKRWYQFGIRGILGATFWMAVCFGCYRLMIEASDSPRLDSLLGQQPKKLALAIAQVELEKAQAAAQLARIIVARLARVEKVGGVPFREDVVLKAETELLKAESDEKAAQARLNSLRE
jgi:hypothetical protein